MLYITPKVIFRIYLHDNHMHALYYHSLPHFHFPPSMKASPYAHLASQVSNMTQEREKRQQATQKCLAITTPNFAVTVYYNKRKTLMFTNGKSRRRRVSRPCDPPDKLLCTAQADSINKTCTYRRMPSYSRTATIVLRDNAMVVR